MTQEAFQSFLKDPSIISDWIEKVRELCKKQGVNLIILGSPYGLEEQLVVGIETDLGVDEFTDLKGMLYRIDPKLIEYSKTTIIIQT